MFHLCMQQVTETHYHYAYDSHHYYSAYKLIYGGYGGLGG